MLNIKNIKINRSSKSLNYKNIKSFNIIKVINNIIYELNLLKKMNIFSIFLFFSFINIDEKETNYFVNKIINSQIDEPKKNPITRRKKYLIYKFK